MQCNAMNTSDNDSVPFRKRSPEHTVIDVQRSCAQRHLYSVLMPNGSADVRESDRNARNGLPTQPVGVW